MATTADGAADAADRCFRFLSSVVSQQAQHLEHKRVKLLHPLHHGVDGDLLRLPAAPPAEDDSAVAPPPPPRAELAEFLRSEGFGLDVQTRCAGWLHLARTRSPQEDPEKPSLTPGLPGETAWIDALSGSAEEEAGAYARTLRTLKSRLNLSGEETEGFSLPPEAVPTSWAFTGPPPGFTPDLGNPHFSTSVAHRPVKIVLKSPTQEQTPAVTTTTAASVFPPLVLEVLAEGASPLLTPEGRAQIEKFCTVPSERGTEIVDVLLKRVDSKNAKGEKCIDSVFLRMNPTTTTCARYISRARVKPPPAAAAGP